MMSVEKNESIYGLSGASIASDRESVIVLRERVRELNYNIYKSLLLDVDKYYHAKKFMKMLKRLLSYRSIKNEPIDEIVSFLNSDAGKLYQFHHKIDVLLFVIEENVDIDVKYINVAVNKLIKSIPDKYKLNISSNDLKTMINEIKNKLIDDINVLVIEFLK